jgi:hypothetical protein
MTKSEKFIEVLRTFDEPVTVAEWAKRIIDLYPLVLVPTNRETDATMTLLELTTVMSVKLSKGEFPEVKVDYSEPYRKVQYISDFTKKDLIKEYANSDREPILYEEYKSEGISKLNESERYRVEEFKSIVTQLNSYFNMNFEIHDLSLVARRKEKVRYHPDNFELLTSEHATKKLADKVRFTIDAQKAYIKRMLVADAMISKVLDIDVTDQVLDMLLDRLEKIY